MPRGYKLHVRAYAADQKLLGEWQQEVQGGSIELGAALQRGVCESLGAVCAVSSNDAQVSVPRAALPDLSVAGSRSRVESGLFGGGVGLLVAAAGVGLYSHVAQSGSPARTALSETSSAGHSASIFAIALAATGAGAIAAGGLIVALTPESASLQARF
jgi:hypothetical protein